MSNTGWRLVFLVASLATAAFSMWMRHRLQTQYPDDNSRQMQSMLGFLRGMAIFAGVVFIAVAIELAWRSV